MSFSCWTLLLGCLSGILLFGCAHGGGEDRSGLEIRQALAAFAPTVIDADRSKLPPSERYALDKIIQAARYLDEVFYRQVSSRNPEIMARLAQDQSAAGRAREKLFTIMKGPWNREQGWKPFATKAPHPLGAGFYPEDMSKEEFEKACQSSPERAKALKGLYTVVRKDQKGQLVAIPYSKVYGQWLRDAARELRAAAELTRNQSLKTFLRSRAAAFLDDDYYQSDKDWMDLDSQVEVTIGPYEVYEDKLFGYKASFEAFVTVADRAASKALERYKSELSEMEQNLPVPKRFKAVRGRESPIRVTNLVFAAGDARTSIQTLAFNLPNDERVRKEKGAKKVLLANVIREKFRQIMMPIGRRVLHPEQVGYLSADAFFNQTLFHELSHSMGPAYVKGDQKGQEIRLALADTYSALEEAKADVMGAINVLYQIQKGSFPESYRRQHLTSYFLGLFRSVRFGLHEAHGKGAALQINSYLRDGAVVWRPAQHDLEILSYKKLEQSIKKLLVRILQVQYDGDHAAAAAMLADLARLSPPIQAVLDRLDGIPVDLLPIYPAAGEKP